jgi:hypothetical protein
MHCPRQVAIVLFMLISLCVQGQKEPAKYSKLGQTVDLNSPKLTIAKQDCENWAVAAGLESMLKQQGVTLDQNFWVMRISGGEVCAPEVPSADSLSGVVNSEFVLENARHVNLELNYVAGAPTNIDAVVMALKQQRLSLLLLRGHPYYLTGVTYDEFINADGARTFVLTELRLADTFAHHPETTFVKGRDSADDIGGWISVSVKESGDRT